MMSVYLIIFGCIVVIFGVLTVFGIFRYKKALIIDDEFLEEHFSERVNKIKDIIVGLVAVLIGAYLLLKGFYDPSFSSFWIRF